MITVLRNHFFIHQYFVSRLYSFDLYDVYNMYHNVTFSLKILVMMKRCGM